MERTHPVETSLWKFLSAMGAVAAVAVAGTWTIAQLLISNELESYRSAKEWNVAEAITSLSELSKELKLDVSERKELKIRREEANELNTKLESANSLYAKTKADCDADIASMREKVVQLEKSNAELSATLAEITKEPIIVEISEGTATYVVPNVLVIGVESAYKSFASVRIAGVADSGMRPGETADVKVAGMGFSVTLMKVTETSCSFQILRKS